MFSENKNLVGIYNWQKTSTIKSKILIESHSTLSLLKGKYEWNTVSCATHQCLLSKCMEGYIIFVPGGFQMSHHSLINSDEWCPPKKVLLPFVVTFMTVKMCALIQPSKPADWQMNVLLMMASLQFWRTLTLKADSQNCLFNSQDDRCSGVHCVSLPVPSTSKATSKL